MLVPAPYELEIVGCATRLRRAKPACNSRRPLRGQKQRQDAGLKTPALHLNLKTKGERLGQPSCGDFYAINCARPIHRDRVVHP